MGVCVCEGECICLLEIFNLFVEDGLLKFIEKEYGEVDIFIM